MTLEQLGNDPKFMNSVRSTLSVFPQEPFLCLPMSCCLLGHIEHECPQYKLAVKTGDLFYKNHLIFKQDFDLNGLAPEDIDTSWGGHAWVEVNDQFIIDTSISRTVASPAFTTPYRDEIASYLGGRCLIIDKNNNSILLRHVEHSTLSDTIINGIIKGACKKYFS